MNRTKKLGAALLASAAVAVSSACTCGRLVASFVPHDPMCLEAPYSNPPTTLQESDLAGTWQTHHDQIGVDRLIINADGTFKQIYEERMAYVVRVYSYETPWNDWWLERFPDGRVRLHLEGARYYRRGKTVAELDGMGFGPQPNPWLFGDPFSRESVEMVGKLILNVRADSRDERLLHHMFWGTDEGFSMIGCEEQYFRRVEGG
jgi:hypothetical protein